MFEKEAKKWVKEHTVIEYKASYGEFPKEPSAIKSFKAGAEFGYNKCKEELNQKGLALQSDMDKTIEQNIALKKELNKANEWHYPSKNELPNCDDKTLLIFIANDYYEINGETIIKKRTVLGFYKKAFINENMKLFVEKSKGYEAEHLPQAVIAWKEIILPKEMKEND